MPFDFPNSPSIGQRVTGVGGIVYVWDGVKWTNSVGGVTVQSMGDVGRNLIHNPLFNVAQRGTSFSATGAQAIYTVDRWVVQSGATGDTAGLLINPAADSDRAAVGDEAFTSMASLTFIGTTNAASMCRLSQKIEGVRRLSGKTVTVSFWTTGSVANKLGVSIDQYFGTGGSPSPSVVGNGQAVTISSTAWARYSVTLAIPSASGKTMGANGDSSTVLNIWGSAGSNFTGPSGGIGNQGTWYANTWGVQLEIGNVATPLEKPDPRYDLANCQRFYQQGIANFDGYLAASAFGASHISIPPMRVLPGVTIGGSLINPDFNVASVFVDTAQTNSFRFVVQAAGATGGTAASRFFSASADL